MSVPFTVAIYTHTQSAAKRENKIEWIKERAKRTWEKPTKPNWVREKITKRKPKSIPSSAQHKTHNQQHWNDTNENKTHQKPNIQNATASKQFYFSLINIFLTPNK